MVLDACPGCGCEENDEFFGNSVLFGPTQFRNNEWQCYNCGIRWKWDGQRMRTSIFVEWEELDAGLILVWDEEQLDAEDC